MYPIYTDNVNLFNRKTKHVTRFRTHSQFHIAFLQSTDFSWVDFFLYGVGAILTIRNNFPLISQTALKSNKKERKKNNNSQ